MVTVKWRCFFVFVYGWFLIWQWTWNNCHNVFSVSKYELRANYFLIKVSKSEDNFHKDVLSVGWDERTFCLKINSSGLWSHQIMIRGNAGSAFWHNACCGWTRNDSLIAKTYGIHFNNFLGFCWTVHAWMKKACPHFWPCLFFGALHVIISRLHLDLPHDFVCQTPPLGGYHGDLL